MLAQGRFQTETPNVIDPGDAPVAPSRPSRSNSPTGSSDDNDNGVLVETVTSTSNSSSSSSPAAGPGGRGTSSGWSMSNKGVVLSRGVKIPTTTPDRKSTDSYGYTLDPDDEPNFAIDDDDDQQQEHVYDNQGGNNSNNTIGGGGGSGGIGLEASTTATKDPDDSKPRRKNSIAQARLFAAAILNESDNRYQERSNHNNAYFYDGAGIYNAAFDPDDPYNNNNQNRSRVGRGRAAAWASKIQNSFRGLRGNKNSSGRDLQYQHHPDWAFDRSVEMFETESGGYSYDPKSFRRRLALRLCLAVTVVTVVITFTVVALQSVENRGGGGGGNNGSAGTTTVTDDPNRLDAILNFLMDQNIVSDERNLYDPTSAQYRAAQWMAVQDGEQVPVPDLTGDNGVNLVEIGKDNPFNFIQRYVLVVLYFAWGGDSDSGNNGRWNRTLNFANGALHECAWFEPQADPSGETYAVGVDCDEHLQVRNLLIPANGLSGRIPDEIRHLSKLDFLDLKHNSITGSLPTALKALPLLDYLDLNANQLTGTIPHWLSDSLPRLKALGLGQNNLHGSIPGSLVRLSNLKTLSLDGNFLLGDASPIQQLHDMEYLYISDNDFIGRLDQGLLADMPALQEADLSGNKFSISQTDGILPRHLFRLERLRVLDLSNNDIAGSLPDDAFSTPPFQPTELQSSLEFLSLRSNSLLSSIPAGFLAGLTSLTHLDLAGNRLTGTIDQIFTPLENLKVLLLNDNLLTGPLPDSSVALNALEVLTLHHNNVAGVIGQPFCSGNLQALEILAVDCDVIDCPCCDRCCGENDGKCFEDILADAEYSFERSDYSFNPHITMDQEDGGLAGGI